MTRRADEPDEGTQPPGGRAAERLHDLMRGRFPSKDDQDERVREIDNDTRPSGDPSADASEDRAEGESSESPDRDA